MPQRRKQPTANARGRSHTFTAFLRREPSGVYTAHIPALDLVTEGQTLEEAKDMARDAVAGWVEAAQEIGKPIPDDVPTVQVEVG